MTAPQFVVLDYLYRDGGNWKTWGSMSLSGSIASPPAKLLSSTLEAQVFFIPEEIGIPSLHQKHWSRFGGPTSEDHVWHEFEGLRIASTTEIADHNEAVSLDAIASRVSSILQWSPTMSNVYDALYSVFCESRRHQVERSRLNVLL